MRKILIYGLVLFTFLVPVRVYSLDGIEIFTGYLRADTREEDDDYQGIPLFFSLDFKTEPILKKIGITPWGKLDFIVEPFINTIIEPHRNIEVGSNFLVKYVFPLKVIQPYFKWGLGVLYMSQHTREQSTQYNFLPQVGGGIHIFINAKTALSFEYRFRHLSNANFRRPNKGIDANLILGGISFFF
jgi:hypothetical protein